MNPTVQLPPAHPRDPIANQLLPIALHYVTLIRDEGPDAIATDLTTRSHADHQAIICLLAALVPDNRTPQQLLAWRPTERRSNIPGVTDAMLRAHSRRIIDRKHNRPSTPDTLELAKEYHRLQTAHKRRQMYLQRLQAVA